MNNDIAHVHSNHQIVLAAFGTSTASSVIYRTLKRQFEAHFSQTIPIGFTSRVGTPTLRSVLESIPSRKTQEVVITPLFMVPGKVVSDDVWKVAHEYAHRFTSLRVAHPLLPDERVYQVLKEALLPDLENALERHTGILFVGHGSPEQESANNYVTFAHRIRSYFPPAVKVAFGNVEYSAPYCRDVVGKLIMSDIKRLVIQPFMIVDGVHIHEDIKGAFEGNQDENELAHHLFTTYGDSFTQRLKEIEFIYKPGLGAYRGIFEMFADHTTRALSAGEVLSQ